MERRKSGFVAILTFEFRLTVAAINVQCRENRAITEGFSAFIYMRYEIRIPDGYGVQLAVVHAKAEYSVFLERKHVGCRPLCLGRFNIIHPQYLVDFLLLNFWCTWAGRV